MPDVSKIEPGQFITVIAYLANPRDENQHIEIRLYARVERNDSKAKQVIVRVPASTGRDRFVFNWSGIEVDPTTKGFTTRLEIPALVGLIAAEQ